MKAFTRVLHRHTDDELMHEARPPSAVSPIPSVPVFTPRRDGGIAAVIRGRRRFRLVGCSDAGTCMCVCLCCCRSRRAALTLCISTATSTAPSRWRTVRRRWWNGCGRTTPSSARTSCSSARWLQMSHHSGPGGRGERMPGGALSILGSDVWQRCRTLSSPLSVCPSAQRRTTCS